MSDRHLVLIVDDTNANIQVLMEILKDDYAVIVAKSGALALRLARGKPKPDIILLDVMMPGMDGYATIAELKADAATSAIPVIFVTSLSDDADESKGLALGAVDFVSKPFNPAIIKLRIANQLALKRDRDKLENLVRARTLEIRDTRLEVIRRLGRAAEYRDNETGLHIIRMSKSAQLISRAAGLSEAEAELVLDASPMHDIGKIGIPDRVLLKPGPLDADEHATMREHCNIGASIIGDHPSALLRTARTAALTHHERWDGKGYPAGLAGADIPVIGRIVAIADVFDALTSKRPYKAAWPVDRARDEIVAGEGLHFDPRLVAAFLEAFPEILGVLRDYPD